MRVKIREYQTGREYVLTEDGDPLRCDDYLSEVRQWGVTFFPSGGSYAGNGGDFVGEFQASEPDVVAEFIITAGFND